MKKLYKYTGTVSGFSYRRNSPTALPFVTLELHDMGDDDKAPIRVEAVGGLADYINKIEGTDVEERYLSADWYYDSNLFLHRIEVPSTEPDKPSKIIAQHDPIEPQVTIFGPAEYIETSRPEPMCNEQRRAWYDYNAEDEYRYTPRRSSTTPAPCTKKPALDDKIHAAHERQAEQDKPAEQTALFPRGEHHRGI